MVCEKCALAQHDRNPDRSRFPWFVKKQEAQNTIDVRREIPPGCESQEMQAPIGALIRDFLDLCKGRRVCYVGE